MEPLVPTLTFEQLRQAKKNASKSLESLNLELSSSTAGNLVANIFGYQNWSVAKASTEKDLSLHKSGDYAGLKLKEAYSNIIKTANSMLQEAQGVVKREGEYYTEFFDNSFDLKLHFSLPIPPGKEKVASNIIGLYITLDIPFYYNFGVMIKFDEREKSFTIQNEFSISSYMIDTKDVISNDGVFKIVTQLIKALKIISREKDSIIAKLISKRFYEGAKDIRFSTLHMNDTWDNQYLYFHDVETKTVFINDITGRNLTSAVNNIEKIYERFNPVPKPQNKSVILSFVKWFRGERSFQESNIKKIDNEMKILILLMNLDKRSILVMDHEFNWIRGLRLSEIQAELHEILTKFLPVKPTGISIV